jgi:hypothetical protein
MELIKIQPHARVRLPGLTLTSLIFLTGSLFAQPGKSVGNAEIYEAIGMMFADGSGLAKMKFTDEQIDQILSGMKKGNLFGKDASGSRGPHAQGSANYDGKDEDCPGRRAGGNEGNSSGKQGKSQGIPRPSCHPGGCDERTRPDFTTKFLKREKDPVRR